MNAGTPLGIVPVSDWHLEYFQGGGREWFDLIAPYHDPDYRDMVLCMAGDVGLFHEPATWVMPLRELAGLFRAVVFVAGNHEFYGNCWYDSVREVLNTYHLPKNVHFLEDDAVVIEGVLFAGATLWTDFGIDGEESIWTARRMDDYRAITHGDGRRITPAETAARHAASRDRIFALLADGHRQGLRTVAVTHHAVAGGSIHPRFSRDPLTSAFVAGLDRQIEERGPDLWIHGHTHDSFDYRIGRTRIICNPYGYHRVEQNGSYRAELVVPV